jgi:outer membrane protein TolC
MKSLLALLLVASPCWADDNLLSVLNLAEKQSPRLKAEHYQQDAAGERIRMQKSGYYPELSAAAIASTGDPGSFAMMGVDGNISAKDRLGAGAGLVLKQDVWDFGRTQGAVHQAEAERDLSVRETALIRLDVDREVLQTYLQCSYLKAEVKDAHEVANLAHLLSRETDRFVRSGQRSIIERYLVDAEAKAADTRIAEMDARVQVIEKRLAVEAGASQALHCQNLSDLEKDWRKLESGSGPVPGVEAQKTRIAVAESRLDRAKAEEHPEILALASGGYFDNRATRDRMNYAAGVGISFPLFEGFRIDAGVQNQKAELMAARSGLDAYRQLLASHNAQYDEQIRALEVRLQSLEEENKLAERAFALARKRYLSLQGTMVDLREAIKNMERVMESLTVTSRDRLLARGERALLNGARNGDASLENSDR